MVTIKNLTGLKILIIIGIFSTSVLAGKIDEFTLNDLSNNKTSYSEIRGEKLTVLDVWAT